MVDKQRTLPELLAPAGDMERLKMAVLYGADAVYSISFFRNSFHNRFCQSVNCKCIGNNLRFQAVLSAGIRSNRPDTCQGHSVKQSRFPVQLVYQIEYGR